jgi:hypothetical protein
MTTVLRRLFEEIVQEAEVRPEFRRRLEAALNSGTQPAPAQTRSGRRNRRSPGILDPFAQLQDLGESGLRQRLLDLTVEQLKDIISDHAMDPSRLALKWKSPARLVDLIVSSAGSRLAKGDAFKRAPPPSAV